MEETQIQANNEVLVNEMYSYAATLFRGGMNSYDVKARLMERGLDETNAAYIADSLERALEEAYKKRGQKNMIYGALWCVGGTILTMADIGFIFWGAIIFGAIQFFRGLAEYMKY